MEEISLNTKIVEFNWNKEHLNAIVDITQKPKRPPMVASCGLNYKAYNGTHYPIKMFSLGNISLITGEEKSRKSFLKSLIEASVIGGKANNYNDDLIKGHLEEGKLIVSIDGEQALYDVLLNGNRIPAMVGNNPDHYKYFMLREYSTNERLQFLEWLFTKSPYAHKLGLVMIDGYVDFIRDFNSQKESGEFVNKLLKWSTIANCHISGVLHLNPNSEKSRGHLGTMLQQKCENVIRVEDGGDFSTVKCVRSRSDIKFEDFTIRIDENWMPYVSNNDLKDNSIPKLS